MEFKELLLYKKWLKGILSILLLLLVTWLHFQITWPCGLDLDMPCEYRVGLPIPFILVSDQNVTDYAETGGPFWFVGGFLLNFLIWYLLLSLLFGIFKRRTKDVQKDTKY